MSFHWTDPDRRERVLALWRDGKTGGEIAAEYGVTRNTVCGFLDRERKKGLPPRVTPLARPKPVKVEAERRRQLRQRDAVKKAAGKRWPLLPTPKPGGLLQAAPVTPTATTLMDLPAFGACKFPVGEATGAAQLFCAGPVDSLYLRYCDAHCRVAYVAPSTRPNPAFTVKSESMA